MKPLSKPRIFFEILVVLAIMLGVKDIADRFDMIGAGSFAMWVGIGVATLFMRQHDISWKSFGLTFPSGGKDWLKSFAVALGAVIAVLFFFAVIMPLVASVLAVEVPEDAADRFEFLLGHPWKLAAYLLVVIWLGAAMGEELLMRGFLLNYLSAFFGDSKAGVVLAVAVHAVIFGSLHIYQGIHGVIATGVVAVIFASVYLLGKRKLFPLIVAHGIVNSISLTAYYLTDGKMT